MPMNIKDHGSQTMKIKSSQRQTASLTSSFIRVQSKIKDALSVHTAFELSSYKVCVDDLSEWSGYKDHRGGDNTYLASDWIV